MKHYFSNKGALAGAVAGLFLFMVVGLLPSSFVGGVLGLKVAQALFGAAAVSEVMSRTVVGLTMVTGILVTGTVFVFGLSCIGWCLGRLGYTARLRRAQRLA